MRRMTRMISVLMILVLMLPTGVLAGRKHKDVENIGNRKINGRIAGIFPILSLRKRRFSWVPSLLSSLRKQRVWWKTRW